MQDDRSRLLRYCAASNIIDYQNCKDVKNSVLLSVIYEIKIMINFIQINNLPILNLQEELQHMLGTKKISWSPDNQICLNTTIYDPDNYMLGSGSLAYDWLNSIVDIDEFGHETTTVKEFDLSDRLKEEDFSKLCNIFIGTQFEKVYQALNEKYHLGRVRIMKLKSKGCLSWHVDSSRRLHFPLKTQKGCLMIIEDEMKHIPAQEWWMTNTLREHTAVNSSKEDRIHLVATILNEKT